MNLRIGKQVMPDALIPIGERRKNHIFQQVKLIGKLFRTPLKGKPLNRTFPVLSKG